MSSSPIVIGDDVRFALGATLGDTAITRTYWDALVFQRMASTSTGHV